MAWSRRRAEGPVVARCGLRGHLCSNHGDDTEQSLVHLSLHKSPNWQTGSGSHILLV